MNVVWLTAFNMPEKERYSKEKQKKKNAAAAKGCWSITDMIIHRDLPFNFPYCKTGFVNTNYLFKNARKILSQ